MNSKARTLGRVGAVGAATTEKWQSVWRSKVGQFLGWGILMVHISRWTRVLHLSTALVAVVAVVFGSVAPAAANAAENRTVVGSGDGAVLLEPTMAQKAEAINRLEQARLADSTGFANRLELIQGSKELMDYLSSDSRFDSGLQQQFLAAAMPTDVLESLVSLTDSGYLTLELADGPNNTKVAKLIKAEPRMIGGSKGSMGMKPMFPQCPSAWAALWAWWGTNAAFCGAMGFFGPMAALGCSAAMAIAGSVIDFNRGC